jgi:hypothetical protein
MFRGTQPTLAIVSAVLLAAPGCSGTNDDWRAKRPKVVPVSGTVLYNGQPLEDATVTFTNAAASRSGYGQTGPGGKFTLTTFTPADGVVPGKQQVTVRKVRVTGRKKPGVDPSTSSEVPPPPEEHWLIPSRYGRAETSGLTVEVTEGGKNDFVIELKDSIRGPSASW